MPAAALGALVKRDAAIVLAALITLTLLAWLVLLAQVRAWDPFAMSGWLLPAGAPAQSGLWTSAYWLIAFCMWAVMMVAMMLPKRLTHGAALCARGAAGGA